MEKEKTLHPDKPIWLLMRRVADKFSVATNQEKPIEPNPYIVGFTTEERAEEFNSQLEKGKYEPMEMSLSLALAAAQNSKIDLFIDRGYDNEAYMASGALIMERMKANAN